MDTKQLEQLVINALEDLKASNINVIDMRTKSNFTDAMVIASGSSNRQVKSLAEHVAEEAKKRGIEVIGVEGQQTGEWVLVDLGNVVVHVMLPQTREFYALEKLWSVQILETG